MLQGDRVSRHFVSVRGRETSILNYVIFYSTQSSFCAYNKEASSRLAGLDLGRVASNASSRSERTTWHRNCSKRYGQHVAAKEKNDAFKGDDFNKDP